MKRILISTLAIAFTLPIFSMEQEKAPSNQINQNQAENLFETLPDEVIFHIFSNNLTSIINSSDALEEILSKSLEFIKNIMLTDSRFNNFSPDLIKVILNSDKIKELLNKKFELIVSESNNLDEAIKKSLEFIKSIKLTSNIFNNFKVYLFELFESAIYNSRFFEDLKDISLLEKDNILFATIFEENLSQSFKLEKIKFLIKAGASVNRNDGIILLVYADFVELARLLIDNGAVIDAKDYAEYTALTYAVQKNNLDILKLLIEKGADVNTKDSSGDSALIFAIRNNLVNIAKLLIENGADVNDKDSIGYTALMHAAMKNNLNIASLLIDKGADVNAIGDGQTALMYSLFNCKPTTAGKSSHDEIIKLLLDNNADVNIWDGYLTPYMVAKNNNLDIAELLFSVNDINYLQD